MLIRDLPVCWTCGLAFLNYGEWHMIRGMVGVYNCLVLGAGYREIGRSQTEWGSCPAEDLGMIAAPTVGRLVSQ